MRYLLLLCLCLFAKITFSQHEPITPDPINLEGEVKGKDSDPRGSGNADKGVRPDGFVSKAAKGTVPLKIGGQVFLISKETRKDFIDLVHQYEITHNVGSAASAIPGLVAIWDLLTDLPTQTKALTDAVSFGEDVAEILTLPSLWSQAIKDILIRKINERIGIASVRGKYNEVQMWKQFIDVIRFPDKYKKENIVVDPITKNMTFKTNELDMTTKIISDLESDLTPVDRLNLRVLCGTLLSYTEVGIYIAYSDLPIRLATNPFITGKDISIYDMNLLNRALYNLPEGYKGHFRHFFDQLQFRKDCSFELWNTLESYLKKENSRTLMTGSDYYTLWITL